MFFPTSLLIQSILLAVALAGVKDRHCAACDPRTQQKPRESRKVTRSDRPPPRFGRPVKRERSRDTQSRCLSLFLGSSLKSLPVPVPSVLPVPVPSVPSRCLSLFLPCLCASVPLCAKSGQEWRAEAQRHGEEKDLAGVRRRPGSGLLREGPSTEIRSLPPTPRSSRFATSATCRILPVVPSHKGSDPR